MENDLKVRLREILKEFNRIDFKVIHHHKGHFIDVEFGNLKNDKCGNIYNELESWLGYEEFKDFLIAHDIYYDFSGYIVDENEDVVIFVVFSGPYEDEFESVNFEFEEDFVKKTLKINSFINSINDFDIANLNAHFYFENGGNIEFIELYYEYSKISLDNNQLELIKEYLFKLVNNNNVPSLSIIFDCIQNWSVEGFDNSLDYRISTSPIKFYWDEIYT